MKGSYSGVFKVLEDECDVVLQPLHETSARKRGSADLPTPHVGKKTRQECK